MSEHVTDTENRTDAGAQETAPAKEVIRNGNVTVVKDPDNPDMVTIRTRKRERRGRRSSHKKRMPKGARIALIVLGVIVGIALIAGVALALAIHFGNVNLHAFEGTEQLSEESETYDDGKTVKYKGHTYRYNDNIVSFLIMGHDDESGYITDRPDASCADMIMLVTIDTETRDVHAIAVPRNSWVTADYYDDNGEYAGQHETWLTVTHAVKAKTDKECAENTVRAVSRIFYNLPINRFVDIDEESVVDITNAIGGVQVEALETIPGTNYVKGDKVLLKGQEALRYVQYRDTNKVESALDRQKRQIQFVKAFLAQARTKGARGLLDIYNSVSDDILTNLEASDAAYLASVFARGGKADVSTSSLKGRTSTVMESNGVEYERYYLSDKSVMKNTLAAYYKKVE